MKKSLTLAMAMALGVTVSAYAANPFSDVPQGHWAYASVAQLAADGVVDGYADGAFAGNKLLTRYEMAQIVAKAMANGAKVDKLAAEFADELDSLGVCVAKLEKGADSVKITGEVRYHYADKDVERKSAGLGYTNSGKCNENQLRSRIWIEGQVDDNWKYTGMLQNTQDFDNETGDEETKFKRAYVEGKIGGVDVLAGRYNAYLVNGNLYDEHADGIELSYGKDVKFTAFAMKPTDQNGKYLDVYDNALQGNIVKEMRYEKAYGAKVYTSIGTAEATVGYTVFKDGKNYETIGSNANEGDIKDNKIWNVGVGFDLARNITLTADYLKSNIDSGNGKYNTFNDDDGLVVGLNYKGAKASEPGTYGLYANYYDQERGTVIAHTMNGEYGLNGFKGYMIGANYTFAKNIVASLEWYNLESKGIGLREGYRIPKQDMETLWAQVVFTF